METKKFYEQPRQEVVELMVKNQLLAGSNTGSPRDDYDEETGNPFGEN